MKKFYLIIFVLPILFWGCSSSDEMQEKKEDIFIIDENNPQENIDTTKVKVIGQEQPSEIKQQTQTNKTFQYIVQIGAFTTEQRANEFSQSSKAKIKSDIIVTFSPEIGLYLVQLPPCLSKQDAEKMRDDLWKTGDFKDAFILTVEK
jgi:cell division septation protein DedD